jgi:hypothetical protein
LTNAPQSRVPALDHEARLKQAQMNIRILALKHATKMAIVNAQTQDHSIPEQVKEINPAAVVAAAGIIEEYLSEGILTPESPATVGVQH